MFHRTFRGGFRLGPALLAAILTHHAGAAAANGGPDFETLAARLDEHPSVAALRAQAEGSAEMARAARGLPDPVLSAGVNNVPVTDPSFDRFLPSNKSVGIRQRIPNPGVRRARSAREQSQGHQFELQADFQIARLRAELIGALAEKQRVGHHFHHAREQLRLLREMERILRGEVEAGRPVYFRLSEIDVERADAERHLADLENERAQADATLVRLVGEAADLAPPDTALRRWDETPQTLFPARLAQTGVRMAEAGVREGRAAYGPDFGVSVQYQQREDGVMSGGIPFSGDDWFSAGVSVSVPLWAAQNQAPKLRAARARESAARASLHDVLRQARERLTALYSAHDTAARNIEILTTKEKSLRELIGSARRNYEAGRGNYLQVLDGELGLTVLRMQLADERARVIKTTADANSYLVTP